VVLRKWLVRGLVFSTLGGILAAGYVYQRWTNPGAVRRQVIGKLRELFPGADISLDSARLRLLGGIALSELRLTRRDDPDRAELAYLPSAILYHDKEQLLDGKLALRKVEMHRPRLRIVRRPDGSWNVTGIHSSRPGEAPMPTIVIQQGSILLEDQLVCPRSPAVEISEVGLTIVNDPGIGLTFTGEGKSSLLGTIQLRGTWRHDSHELIVHAQAAPIAVGPTLVRRLGRYCKDIAGPVKDLEGTGTLEADLTYRAGAATPWSHDVRIQLANGKVRHPLLPLPVEQLEAVVRCVNGHLTTERLTGRAGRASLNVSHGEVYRTSAGYVIEARGQIEHLLVNEELCACLPDKVKKFYEDYRPAGLIGVDFDLTRAAGKWDRQHWVLRPEGMSADFVKFPYALEQIRGRLDFTTHDKHTVVDLIGYTGSRPVTIRGTCDGEGNNVAVKIDIAGSSIPLDEKLIRALPPTFQSVARKFHLRGLGDIKARIQHAPGAEGFDNHYAVDVHHASLQWEPFPYPLDEVTGHLDIHPGYWELTRFHGVRNKGEFSVSGRSFPPRPGDPPLDGPIKVAVIGRNVQIDDDLKGAVQPFPCVSGAWNTFRPTGRMSFRAQVDRLPRQPQDLDVTMNVEGCSVEPLFFPYRLHDLSGQFHYGKNVLTAAGVNAQHGESRVQLPLAKVKLHPDGSYYADLTDLQANPLLPDDDLLRALPAPLQKPWEALRLQGPFALKTQLIVSQKGKPGVKPDIFWDGEIWLRDARMQVGLPLESVTGRVASRGRHTGDRIKAITGNIAFERATLLGLPFHDVHTKLDVYEKAPDVVVLGLQAPIFDGRVSGPARIEMGSTLRYELDLTASEIDLGAFGRHSAGPRSQMSGIMGGRLHLTGKGTGIASLEGNGSLDMPKGHLYNLPLLLDLLKFLGLRWPDRTAFDQAHAAFSIHGDRMSFSALELYGNAVSLHGQGDMKLDGSDVRLDFIPVWGRIEQVLPPVWQPLPSAIGKNLLLIEARGKLGTSKDLHFHKKPVPGLLVPLLQMRDRIARAAGSPAAKEADGAP
jgi:hypothetical protein